MKAAAFSAAAFGVALLTAPARAQESAAPQGSAAVHESAPQHSATYSTDMGEPASDPLDQFTDAIRQATQFRFGDTPVTLDFDFWVTLDNWVVSQPPPGIMVTPNTYLMSPRLSIVGALAVGDWMEIFALGNLDRGFDPTDGGANIRPDEYFLRLNPFEGIATFTLGKEQTVYGQWVNRHFSWTNPLVNAPLAYEWIGRVNAALGTVAPKALPANRATWVPAIWGPSYTSGVQLTGTVECFDYGFEIKNDSLSSAVTQWDVWNHGIYGDALTYTGRLGWRPDADWNVGVSASTGSYVNPGAFAGWQGLKQTVVGMDVSWAHGPLELWAEALWSQWDVRASPNSLAGTVGLASYFVEAKWKFMPSWWLAGRWNQQLPGDKPFSNVQWDNDVWRIDACMAWRIDRTVTVKAQYSYTKESGAINQGENVFDLQVVIGF